jgi:cellobiose-specific phosphotransferase system component IIA
MRLAKLDEMPADLAAIADRVRDISSAHDAHTHLIWKTARANRGAMTETRDADSVQSVLLTQATDAVVRSKATAEALDDAVEVLERLAASLRDE